MGHETGAAEILSQGWSSRAVWTRHVIATEWVALLLLNLSRGRVTRKDRASGVGDGRREMGDGKGGEW